ncbi:asparaginase domain-containing protein [Azomonas macrocytogenes]|uniref:L-asparaginase n=1 Tax=Azomonas macrocytogenes TaxID=69962 RepID=A0A839T136_AZOMA|nr:asparaginase domain-containing protein [Azomonas macrocytogenes]MBB3102280.1 L-asparaginase [Azomonas macrocytogenes]
MNIQIFTTGGTFDKIYYDALSDFRIGDPMASTILDEARVTFDYTVDSLVRKDSLELTDADRELIHERVAASPARHILITHGTDTMTATAAALKNIPGKVIVFTGAMQPARMRLSDAPFNLGLAIGALQILPEGIYIAINGRIFEAANVRKNRAEGRFEEDSTD